MVSELIVYIGVMPSGYLQVPRQNAPVGEIVTLRIILAHDVLNLNRMCSEVRRQVGGKETRSLGNLRKKGTFSWKN